MSDTTPSVRKNDIVVQELGNELLIYDLNANKALSLNETLSLVWQLSDGGKTISEIATEAAKRLNTPVTSELVWIALGQLKKENLIENEADIPNHYQGANRREVIRKVGLASMVVLPVITSLIAPNAAYAQSTCGAPPFPLGCTCTSNTLCSSTCCRNPIGGSGPCVPANTVPLSGACVKSCECTTSCCGGGSCRTTGNAPGVSCVAPCQCTSLSCAGPGSTCT